LIRIRGIIVGHHDRVVLDAHIAFQSEEQVAGQVVGVPGAVRLAQPGAELELVKGIPINKFCDENHLTAAQRLELFVSVCQAVQHAHQKGIIHRDLKPSNVLVALYDDRPVPKIIDFGVAKAAHQQLTDKTLFTQVGQIVGTWEYMSPEQAVLNQLDVDTRTDIYSLGVILYELLTGVTPLESSRLRSAALDEMLRLIREEEPPKPSTRITTLGKNATAAATYRGTNPPSLAKTPRGDLDWIVMKTLEKNRARRYDTAKDLADDVQNYLSNQPVEARAPSALYRLQKLVRRYRAAAATMVAVAATLVAATVFSTWMAYREICARERMQTAMLEADRQGQHAEDEAQKARKAATDAELALEVISAALGRSESNRLMTGEEAVRQTLQALEKRLDSNSEKSLYVEANVRSVIGNAYWNIGKPAEARAQFQHALEARRKVVGGPDASTAEVLHQLGLTTISIGRPEEAEKYLRESAAMWTVVTGGEGSIGEAKALCDLAQSLIGIGPSKAQEALAIAKKGLDIARRSGGHENGVIAWCTAAIAACHCAIGDHPSEVAALRGALAIFQRTRDYEGEYEIWNRLGEAFSRQTNVPDAKDAYSHALKLAEGAGIRRIERRHFSTAALCDVLFKSGDYPGAEKLYRDFLRSTESELGNHDPRLMEHRAGLVCVLAAQGREKEAETLRDEALRVASPEDQR
jgi:eukaryotic-like serine/threonine-protein kinase